MVKAASNEAQRACGDDVAVMAAEFENVDILENRENPKALKSQDF